MRYCPGPRLLLAVIVATLCGCGQLAPPRPLGEDEIYVCQPFSAIRDRVPANTVLYRARVAPKHGTSS